MFLLTRTSIRVVLSKRLFVCSFLLSKCCGACGRFVPKYIYLQNCPNPEAYKGQSLCYPAGQYCGECVSFVKVSQQHCTAITIQQPKYPTSQLSNHSCPTIQFTQTLMFFIGLLKGLSCYFRLETRCKGPWC